MKKLILILLAACLFTGCSAPSAASPEASSEAFGKTSSTSSIISSAESEPVLTGIDLYMKCFNDGKYDIYNLKIGDPIQKAIDEFGPGEKHYYGLGADCYDFGNIVVSFADGTELYENRVIDFDIVGDGMTVYGLTTGLSTVKDVEKVFGEPEAEWMTGHHAYESVKMLEDFYDEGEKYFFIQYLNKNKEFSCHIDFFFEYGILTVISLCTSHSFDS